MDDFDRYENDGIRDLDLDLLQSQPDHNLDHHHQIYNQAEFANEQADNNPPPQWSDDDQW